MTPRNLFEDNEESHTIDLTGKSDEEILGLVCEGRITVNEVRAFRGWPTKPPVENLRGLYEEDVPEEVAKPETVTERHLRAIREKRTDSQQPRE